MDVSCLQNRLHEINPSLLQATPTELELDNSTFEAIQTCPVAGLMRLLKLKPRGPSAPLVFGGAVHAAMEYFFKSEQPDLMTAVKVARTHAAENHLDDVADDKRNYDRLEQLIRVWFVYYKNNPNKRYNLLVIDGKPAVELPFRVLLGTLFNPMSCHDMPIYWTGKIDLVDWDEVSQSAWVVDHKTASMMGESFVKEKVRSSQFLGYHFALQTLLPQLKVKGTKVNVFYNAKTTVDIKPVELPTTWAAVQEWQTETVKVLRRAWFTLMDSDLSAFPANRNNCVGKYGACRHYDFCNQHPANREKWLAGMYEHDSWSPLGDE